MQKGQHRRSSSAKGQGHSGRYASLSQSIAFGPSFEDLLGGFETTYNFAYVSPPLTPPQNGSKDGSNANSRTSSRTSSPLCRDGINSLTGSPRRSPLRESRVKSIELLTEQFRRDTFLDTPKRNTYSGEHFLSDTCFDDEFVTCEDLTKWVNNSRTSDLLTDSVKSEPIHGGGSVHSESVRSESLNSEPCGDLVEYYSDDNYTQDLLKRVPQRFLERNTHFLRHSDSYQKSLENNPYNIPVELSSSESSHKNTPNHRTSKPRGIILGHGPYSNQPDSLISEYFGNTVEYSQRDCHSVVNKNIYSHCDSNYSPGYVNIESHSQIQSSAYSQDIVNTDLNRNSNTNVPNIDNSGLTESDKFNSNLKSVVNQEDKSILQNSDNILDCHIEIKAPAHKTTSCRPSWFQRLLNRHSRTRDSHATTEHVQNLNLAYTTIKPTLGGLDVASDSLPKENQSHIITVDVENIKLNQLTSAPQTDTTLRNSASPKSSPKLERTPIPSPKPERIGFLQTITPVLNNKFESLKCHFRLFGRAANPTGHTDNNQSQDKSRSVPFKTFKFKNAILEIAFWARPI